MLWLPLVQQNLELFEISTVVGAYKMPVEPEYDENTVWSGEFQDKYSDYFKYQVGFRDLLVRLYNQIAFSLYDEAHLSNVVVGKNNQLFQDFYIDAYVGKDFVGENLINEQCAKLKKIQDTLSKKGIHFLVLLAPGKADFFPEHIPNQYKRNLNKKLPNNYQAYSKVLFANRINLIDFNKWFIEHKNKTEYPLYPQGGIHWSLYSVAIAADTLMANMKRISGKNYSKIKMIGAEIREDIPEPDRDLSDGMNLLFPIKAYKTAFPIMQFDTLGKIKPDVLTISDSYYNNLVELGFVTSTFSPKSWNWGSFNMAHSAFTDAYIYVNELDVQKEIEQRDFVIIISTVPNLNRFGWGFIDKVYDIYFRK